MSFLSMLLDNLASKPSLAAFTEIHGTEKRRSSGLEVAQLIARARGFIGSAGVEVGDRVALLAPNSVQWIATDLAIIASGAIVVPLYDRQEPRELATMLRSSRPKLLIAATHELAKTIADAWPEHERIVTFADLFAAEPSTAPVHEIQPADTVAIIYTSGTSGVPKGVMLTRANLDFMLPRTAERLAKVVGGRDRPDEVFHFLPLCFAASRLALWTQLYRPNPVMLSTDLANLVQEIDTARPHYFLTVPAVLERIRNGVAQKVRDRGGLALALFERGWQASQRIDSGTNGLLDRLTVAVAKAVVFAKIKRTIGPDLEFLIAGSAPLSEETQRWFSLLGIRVYQVYGLTETTGIVSIDDPDRVVFGRVGHAVDGVETRITDEGELVVRGPNIFAGYWDMPEETAQVVRDGWFHTGDQVDIEGGNIRIVGRIKNLIIPESGHNVAPEPLEHKFMEYCPAAQHCLVVGHGKPWLGIIVTGTVSPEAVQQAIDRLNGEVPFYRKIRKYYVAPEPFSVENGLLTANQKIKRRVIEERYRGEIDGLYAS